MSRVGKQTFVFDNTPVITAVGTIAGALEAKGPIGTLFDEVVQDETLGQRTWEQAEVKLLERALKRVMTKAGLQEGDIDVLIMGDLLNQLSSSSFAARTLDRPFFGVYAACACWTESLTLAAALVDGGYADRVAVGVSSHHNSAEKQFRFPTEFAVQRPPTSTWTATGGAAAVVAESGDGPRITHATPGRIIDIGVKDPYDLGSAMAPAAADTIAQHLRDTERTPEDYDLIITGDLGRVGKPIAEELLRETGFEALPRLDDCGIRLYYQTQNDVHGGGSGCACSGLTFGAQLYPDLFEGRLGRILLVSTGAMFSPTTYQQGESIPGIAYAIAIEGGRR